MPSHLNAVGANAANDTHRLSTKTYHEGAPVDCDARVVARRAVAPVPDGFFSAAKAMVVKASRGEGAGASIVDAVEAATTAPSF